MVRIAEYNVSDLGFVINLYRSYQLDIAFPSNTQTLNKDDLDDICREVEEHQGDILKKICGLRDNFINYVDELKSSKHPKNSRSIFAMPLSWFKEHDNDFFMLFYNTLMSIREILPTLPSTKFTLSDHPLSKKISKF